jgi:spoIIIJ-associated protein
MLGIGAHLARVRLELLTRKQAPSAMVSPPTSISRPAQESTPIVLPTAPVQASDTPTYMDVESEDEEELTYLSDSDEVPENEQDEEAAIGKVVLTELLERMSVRGRVIVRRAKPGEQGEAAPWILDVNGSNLNRLIGRRGETLASLQYVTRLITSRELQRRAEVIVDVEGYKARRARTLHSLALRMAAEAAERGRMVALEPMPPHERRIIHLALRGRTDVTTKSVGEGPARKVTIVPRSQA